MIDTSSPALVVPQLIVGFGNPGAKYDQTRHNIGFAAVDKLARTWQISLSENRKFQGEFGEGRGVGAGKIRLLKPLTYMNLSVLVIYDDMDLPIGKIRMRLSGSAGGHNGMKSAIAHLGTQSFPRLRIGIGSPKHPDSSDKDTVNHVLGQFSKAESQVLTEVLQSAVAAIELSLNQGVEKAMNLYNSRTIASITEKK
jgi:peptidyl-tRNA hydrolase, PTH1 family